MKKRLLLLAPLFIATSTAADLSYTHLDIGYLGGNAELPNGLASFFGLDKDLDINGLIITGRYEVTNNFFVYANFEDGEIEADFVAGGGFDLDFQRLEVGLGGYVALGDSVDFHYSVGYKWTELDDGFDSQRLGNIDLLVGLRWAPAGWLEINPYVKHSIGVRDDDFLGAVDVTTAGIHLYVTTFSYVQPFGGVSYELDSTSGNLISDLVLYSAGLRFSF